MISHEVFLTKPPVGLSTDGSTVTGRSTSTSVSLFVRRFYSDVHSQHLRIIKYNCTAVRLYGCTTVRLYGCTTVQLYDCTTVRPSLTKRINRTAAENAAFLSVRVSTWFFFSRCNDSVSSWLHYCLWWCLAQRNAKCWTSRCALEITGTKMNNKELLLCLVFNLTVTFRCFNSKR